MESTIAEFAITTIGEGGSTPARCQHGLGSNLKLLLVSTEKNYWIHD